METLEIENPSNNGLIECRHLSVQSHSFHPIKDWVALRAAQHSGSTSASQTAAPG